MDFFSTSWVTFSVLYVKISLLGCGIAKRQGLSKNNLSPRLPASDRVRERGSNGRRGKKRPPRPIQFSQSHSAPPFMGG